MYKFLVAALAVSSLSVAQAAPSIAAGKTKSATCTACHSADGNSVTPTFPKIAGQNVSYIEKQLKDFKSGARKDATMTAMVAPLNDEDMASLAMYFASQNTQEASANKDLVDAGQKLYLAGNADSKVTACIACHGPQGEGNEAAKYPQLSGQHATYTEAQLQKFKKGERDNDLNSIMRDIARNMSDADMKAVASYVQGLY